MNSHLTDEMLTDVLAGEGSAQALAHLDICDACRLEVEQISGAFAELRQQSLTWAESQRRRPAARPSAVLAFPRSRLAAAAILLACAAAGGVFRVVERTPSVHKHAAGSLADDNRLLLSIDQELSTQDPSPQEMYSTSTTAKSAANAAVRE